MGNMVRWGEFWFLYGRVIRLMGRIKLWMPIIIQAALAIALAWIHYSIFSPVASPIISAWTNLLNAEYAPAFFEYPSHFVLMPYFFGNARLVLNILTEAFLFGVLIDLLIAVYRNQRPAFAVSFGHALRRYLPLTITWAVVIILLYVINAYFNDFLENVIGYSLQGAPRRQILADIAFRGLTVLIYAPFIFLLPSIMAGGVSLRRAIARGFRIFVSHPFVAIGLVLIPYLIALLPSIATSQSARVVASFYPELVFYIILVSIVIDMFVNFLLIGTAVKFYLDQTE